MILNVNRALLVCALVLSTGCTSDASSLSVDVRTDLVAQIEFDEVRVLLGGAREDTLADANTPWLDAVRVARFEELRAGTQSLELQLLREGEILIRRPTTAQLRPGINVVTIVVTRSCLSVRCPGADPTLTACLGGQCVDPGCSEENPELCAEPECVSASTCAPMSDCAEARCLSGACVYAARPGGCDDGFSCIPDEGCRVNVTPSDAGVPDAGTPDVGTPDAGTPDVGTPDAGTPDTGGPDAVTPCSLPCLLLHYDFESAPSGPLVDQSGNGHDAVLIGEPAAWVEGPVGQAWQFHHNVDEYLAPFDVPAQPYTFAFWLRIDRSPVVSSSQHQLITLEDSADERLLQVRSILIAAESRVVAASYDELGRGHALSANDGLAVWNHYAYVAGLAKDTVTLYIDGVSRGEHAWHLLPRPVAQVRLGGLPSVEADGLASIDDVRFYAGALSEVEIMALATPDS